MNKCSSVAISAARVVTPDLQESQNRAARERAARSHPVVRPIGKAEGAGASIDLPHGRKIRLGRDGFCQIGSIMYFGGGGGGG